MSDSLFVAQKKQSTVDVVINNFRELLLQKKLLPGDKIPSELEIAEGLGVSRGSVREAMKILSAFGVVEIKVGNGTYVSSEPPKKPLIDSLSFSFMLFNPALDEILEFRRLLELGIIELIIKNKDKNKDLRIGLEENLKTQEKLRDANAGSHELARNDLAFHRLLGEACYNRLLQKTYDFVLDYLEPSIYNSHIQQDNGAMSILTHKLIIEAIQSNDSELAEAAVLHSVDVWGDLQPKSENCT